MIGIFLVWCVSIVSKGMGPGAGEVFKAFLGDPDEVSDLDGFVHRGDGYDVQVRFRAGSEWIAGLPYRDFTKTDCTTARTKIRFSFMRLAAWPLWRPEELTGAVCYRRFGENAWSPNGRDYILADPRGGWVYFAGEGREHDRAFPAEGAK